MALSDDGETNPFQSPSAEADVPSVAAGPIHDPVMVKKFRQQIHSLGSYWVFCGLVAIVLIVVRLMNNRHALDASDSLGITPVFLLLIGALGLTAIAIGVLSLYKQIWAVYVGLVLSYVSFVMQVLHLNFCGLIVVLAVILQSHRVIGYAKQMREAGVPLTAKPSQTPLQQTGSAPKDWGD